MEYDTTTETRDPRNRYLSIANRLLGKHPDPGFGFKLLAINFRGSRLVNFGFNRAKTHPEMIKLASKFNIRKMYRSSKTDYISCSLHAEVSCLTTDGDCDTLVVVRKLSDGTLANARPCNLCLAKIVESGVKEVYFSTEDGFKRMRIHYG